MARRGRRSSSGYAAPREAGWIVRRVLLVAGTVVALSFAVQGGEFGTTDLLRQRSELARERVRVDSLEARVQELVALKAAVEGDAETQERIAREEFGMVKRGEVLYRFTEPADTSR
jgi:cell division protein FtsB